MQIKDIDLNRFWTYRSQFINYKNQHSLWIIVYLNNSFFIFLKMYFFSLIAILLSSQLILILDAQECVRDPIPQTNVFSPGSRHLIAITPLIEQHAFNASLMWNDRNAQSSRFYALTCIRNVQQQIVAGIIYTLNVTIKETNCDKSLIKLSSDLTNCKPLVENSGLDCIFIYRNIFEMTGPSIDLTSDCIERYPTTAAPNGLNTSQAAKNATRTTTTKSPVIVGGEFIFNFFKRLFWKSNWKHSFSLFFFFSIN